MPEGHTIHRVARDHRAARLEPGQGGVSVAHRSRVLPDPLLRAPRHEVVDDPVDPGVLDTHDLAGRRVATLCEGELADGRHEVTWETGDVPAGVYVLRLATEVGSLSRRLVVAR